MDLRQRKYLDWEAMIADDDEVVMALGSGIFRVLNTSRFGKGGNHRRSIITRPPDPKTKEMIDNHAKCPWVSFQPAHALVTTLAIHLLVREHV